MAWSNGTFTRTDGTFNGSDVWEQNRRNDVKILATSHDTHDEDIADGIDSCLARDGSNSPTANISLRSSGTSYRHTGVGKGTARNHYCSAEQHQDGEIQYAGTSSGAANIYAVTLSPAVTAYAGGLMCWFTAHQNNTSTTPTLNINTVGAKTIHKMSGALASSDILTNAIVWVVYDDAADEFMMVNPAAF